MLAEHPCLGQAALQKATRLMVDCSLNQQALAGNQELQETVIDFLLAQCGVTRQPPRQPN